MTDESKPVARVRSRLWTPWRWKLHWQILLGLVLGLGLGLLSGRLALQAAPKASVARDILVGRWDYVLYSLAGQLFLNGLQLIVVPLVASSLVVAMRGIGQHASFGRLLSRTMAYYLVTSTIAILIGLALVNLIQPGVVESGKPVLSMESTQAFAQETTGLKQRAGGAQWRDFLNVFLEMVPPNIVAAAAEGRLLGLITVSMLIGYFNTRLTGSRRQVVDDFWQGVYEVTLMITELVLRFAPLGVMALLARTFADSYASLAGDDRLIQFARIIAMFFVTVVSALAIHVLVVLPLILRLVGRVRPGRHFKAMAPALMTAFSTASSAATLPLTMECAEERAGVSRETCGFVLPLGATVNMDGTALYECVAAMFIAQAYGIHIPFAQQFFIVLVALLTSIGVAGVPQASLVAIVIILTSVGVPIEGLAVILVVDRVLDMCRTAVNVFSDSCGAVVIARGEGQSEFYPD
ncbi:MAG: Proton glutamate symport protein [Planctomycetes bacterium ADurb.Bin126]|nr:MAG: Proton glutamate symport protein [Planctomycetes bacterium ADurb.Bin126]HOD80447.1 dicarboxylate/amino acid:cation symporter [Phycisphaerae bacterium]HQL72761.1 dicarboxylate/amino acid:cation symporter [Phycisphaerae bacterium]